MTVAELFIKIGVAGAEGVTRSLTGVQKGLGGLLDTSLATKAGILGVIAGLERLTGFASQVGMDLNKFAMTTGLSTDKLQNWQYMGEKFDVTGKEMASTITGLQSTITDMMLGKGMPEGAAALGIKMTRDPFDLMKQLTKRAKELPPDVARNLIKSFGISDDVFQMMRSVNLEMDKIKSKDIISTKEIKKLTDINKAWKDMWFTMKTMGVKIIAAEGLGAVQELANAFKLFSDAGKYLFDLMEKFKGLKVVAGVLAFIIATMFSPVTAAIAAATALIALFSQIQKFREGKDTIFGRKDEMQDLVGDSFKGIKNDVSGFWNKITGKKQDQAAGPSKFGVPQFGDDTILPKTPSAGGSSSESNVNVTNTIHINGAENPADTGAEVKKAVSNATFQYPAMARSR